MQTDPPAITVRDAREADLSALTAIKGAGSEALHRDRLRDARSNDFRYLVLEAGHQVIGFACLVFRRPASWSDAADTSHLPQIVDLQVQEDQRGQGYGTAFMHTIEQIAANSGCAQLYLSVEPVENPRAHALYLRLGYRSLQAEPTQKHWQFTDSAGCLHSGDMLVVDMVKDLRP